MLGRIRCRFDRVWLNVLRRVFRFDAWHANAPYSCRPYKKCIVDLANSLHPLAVVEVGCGLGEILSRIRADRRYGLDLDGQVVRAARFLHPRGVAWIVGTVSDIEGCLAAGTFIDCLIMVNWIHNVSPDDLASALAPLLPRTRHLILDAVDESAAASYRVKHDFAFLAGQAIQIAAVRVADEPRRFLLYRTVF